jgi:DNA-3-methyladenine glycosylase
MSLADLLAHDDPVVTARGLVGAILLTPAGRVRLTELEAYGAPGDKGSHAYRGMTPRNQVMFGPPGRVYMYVCYGMHWMLNLVCRPEGSAGAVLVRGVQPLDDIPGLRPGPGNVAKALLLHREHYGADLFDPASPIQLIGLQPASAMMQGVRIGIAPGFSEELPNRFWDAEQTQWVSAHRRGVLVTND